MTRQEALAIAKPILFNTLMVQAILDNRKTVTRRVIKRKYSNTHFMFRTDKYGTEFVEMQNDVEGETFGKNADGSRWNKLRGYIRPKLPYKVGDILYVRETGLIQSMKAFGNKVKMLFKADDSLVEFSVSEKEYERLSKWAYFQKWLSPYWLTKETARIFLRVTDVRVERLQDITEEQIKAEGTPFDSEIYEMPCNIPNAPEAYLRGEFMRLWDSTIKKADLDTYGWNANSWVWVIEFERVTVE